MLINVAADAKTNNHVENDIIDLNSISNFNVLTKAVRGTHTQLPADGAGFL